MKIDAWTIIYVVVACAFPLVEWLSHGQVTEPSFIASGMFGVLAVANQVMSKF